MTCMEDACHELDNHTINMKINQIGKTKLRYEKRIILHFLSNGKEDLLQ